MAKIFVLGVGDAVALLGGMVVVHVRSREGRKIKLAFEAPDHVRIDKLDQPPAAAGVVAAKGVVKAK